jgi:hypothetical protein
VTAGLRRLDSPLTTYSLGSSDTLFGRYSGRLQGFLQFSLRLP